MGDMLDGFGMGRGLYQNNLASVATNGIIPKEDSGDGFLSDAGVESIVDSCNSPQNGIESVKNTIRGLQ